MKSILVIAVILLSTCAKAPSTLSPVGQRTYQANQAVVAIGTLQHAAIELNKVQVCVPPPDGKCHPLLSDNDTGIVVDAVANALTVVKQVPDGWKPTFTQALATISQRLSQAGKPQLAAYITAVNTVLNSL